MLLTTTKKRIDSATRIFQSHSGILKTGDALSLGIHRRTLYAMRDELCSKVVFGLLYTLDDGVRFDEQRRERLKSGETLPDDYLPKDL